ncbi:MAG: M61 family metallopeptidase [Maribacter sp.]|nr:M61 family metallopeptidase [Maribacter sp.]
MRTLFILIALLLFTITPLASQTISYEISFENAAHHEAEVKVAYTNIEKDVFSVRMSRTSPGRYALHEFAKNVYNFEAFDGKGKTLKVDRPNTHEWQIMGHDGSVNISYTLFANRGDGTYSQVDETHAHLNIPATFMYAPALKESQIEVNFRVREDLNWKVATQMPLVSGTTYSALNFQYFMDSPTEISDFNLREFKVDSKNIRLILHHSGTEQEMDTYFEKVKKVVLAEKDVYGELPNFDYNTYTFLACYIPNASGDGMEHRNSTILTSTRSLAKGGMEGNIGTVSHEFFHAWNVERIRPKSLEPFNFEEANMSGELWFAEGFTSYYTNLILCRAKLISPKQYVEGLGGTFNYVWNSPGRRFFSPIEMSYQAPFVDAARSVDPVNRDNTFISYYSYGSALGLALDLSLRQKNLTLDDYMKLVWKQFGKNEIPYTIQDLHRSLNAFAGNEFGDRFFNSYIFQSEMPDFKALFETVGVVLNQNSTVPYFGVAISVTEKNKAIIQLNTQIGTAAYNAGLDKGDVITRINETGFEDGQTFNDIIQQYKVGDELKVDFVRNNQVRTTMVKLDASSQYTITFDEMASKESLAERSHWLKID